MNFYMLEDPYAYRTARNIVEIGSLRTLSTSVPTSETPAPANFMRMTPIYETSHTRSWTFPRPYSLS